MKKKAKKSRKAKVPVYWWFGAETVNALRDQLNASGDARLEVRIDAKKSMTLTVVPLSQSDQAAALVAFSPLNKSHYCPPQCS